MSAVAHRMRPRSSKLPEQRGITRQTAGFTLRLGSGDQFFAATTGVGRARAVAQ
jgi:hypothetical protein